MRTKALNINTGTEAFVLYREATFLSSVSNKE